MEPAVPVAVAKAASVVLVVNAAEKVANAAEEIAANAAVTADSRPKKLT